MYMMGIYGSVTIVLWLEKETSFQEIKTECVWKRVIAREL